LSMKTYRIKWAVNLKSQGMFSVSEIVFGFFNPPSDFF